MGKNCPFLKNGVPQTDPTNGKLYGSQTDPTNGKLYGSQRSPVERNVNGLRQTDIRFIRTGVPQTDPTNGKLHAQSAICDVIVTTGKCRQK